MAKLPFTCAEGGSEEAAVAPVAAAAPLAAPPTFAATAACVASGESWWPGNVVAPGEPDAGLADAPGAPAVALPKAGVAAAACGVGGAGAFAPAFCESELKPAPEQAARHSAATSGATS